MRRAFPALKKGAAGSRAAIISAFSSHVSLLKQRFGPVAPAMKFVHWVCEEMDQRFTGYSV
jgi:hypothetical protein